MEVVAATHDLRIGGSQLYVLLVAEQLERLGHRVTVHSPERDGPLATVADERQVRVARSPAGLPASCDAVLVQDAAMSHRLAEVYTNVPQVFRCPSELFDLQLPPQVPGRVSELVALSERVAGRLRALAVAPPVTRLRQPVDTVRFAGGESLRPRPRRALLLGNYLTGDRRDLLVEAWGASGVECVVAGGQGESTTAPEAIICDAEIVVAKGRAALEGMSCGRAVYLYDAFGCDGWVTPESYPDMEADGFAGQSTSATPSSERLQDDLERYSPEMGMANRDLVLRHHCPRRHAESLAGLLAGAAPRAESPDTPSLELARLTLGAWRSERRAFVLAAENRRLLARLREAERTHTHERERALASERSAEEERSRARRAERELDRVTRQRTYRAARALQGVADPLRRRGRTR